MRFELELRNMRHPVVMDVLLQAGGQPTGALSVQGDGWQARLEELEPAQVGSIVGIRRDLLIIEGDDEAIVTPVYDFIRKNMLRGGG